MLKYDQTDVKIGRHMKGWTLCQKKTLMCWSSERLQLKNRVKFRWVTFGMLAKNNIM